MLEQADTAKPTPPVPTSQTREPTPTAGADAEDRAPAETMKWHVVVEEVASTDDVGNVIEERLALHTLKYKRDLQKFLDSLPETTTVLYVFQGHAVEFKPRRVFDLGERLTPGAPS